jgi:hypothetical protein
MMHRVHGTGPEFVRLGGQKRGKIFYFIAALNEWMKSGVVQTASCSSIASNMDTPLPAAVMGRTSKDVYKSIDVKP